jgi:hypothetical protein
MMIMKKVRQLILVNFLLLFSLNLLSAQTVFSVSDSSVFAGRIREANVYSKADCRKNMKDYKKEYRTTHTRPATFRLFLNRTFAPKLSVDLLVGKGIHLFTISHLNPIPTINVGARINAGIVITL